MNTSLGNSACLVSKYKLLNYFPSFGPRMLKLTSINGAGYRISSTEHSQLNYAVILASATAQGTAQNFCNPQVNPNKF